MHMGIKNWRRDEFASFALIFLALILHLLLVRYPIIYFDSRRYLSAALNLSTDARFPTLVCYLIRPLVILMGAWGFAIFQIVLLTYVLVSSLKFFGKHSSIGILSIIISAAGFMATAVMMDIYTAIGLLALFLILNGSRDIILCTILSICFVAHYGNVFMFPVYALLHWLIFNRKNFATLALVIILFIIPLLIACAVNYGLEENFRFLPKRKYLRMAVSIMKVYPELTKSYMKKRFPSRWAEYKQKHVGSRKKMTEEALRRFFWNFDGPVNINKEAKKFIAYTVRNNSGILLKKIIPNTYKFLKRPYYRKALAIRETALIKIVNEFLPHQMEQAKKSLQYRDNLSAIVFDFFYRICYSASLLVISAFLICSICFIKLRKTKYFSFVVFAITTLVVNALIMHTRGSIGRLQVRMLILPCLAMCLIVSDLNLWRKGINLWKR